METVYLFTVSKSDGTGTYGNAIAENGKILGHFNGNSTQEIKNALKEKIYPGYQKEWVGEKDVSTHQGLVEARHKSFNRR